MNVEKLFQEALAKPLHERAGFLDALCAEDADLRAAVQAMLDAHERTRGASAASSAASEATSAYTPEPAPTTDHRSSIHAGIGIADRYILESKLGEGGMGEVWAARQTQPVKRLVALKLIKAGMDSKAVLKRFEAERQALALMDHPNIAKVLDAGLTAAGQPFFVMEFVSGPPLNKFCDEAKLGVRERLELFVPICQAVQHAHHKGIVHRDLKPANILVTTVDGRPIPKVIDFGVAKAISGTLTDEALATQFGAVVGTLEYMAPEQAAVSGEDIDTRADIYSLGVILYEMLTGLRPIDAKRLRKAALTEMIRILRDEEPSKPSTRLSTDDSLASSAAVRRIEPGRLMALLRGELDWVVMKCLEKQRDRRYETANGLARDIQRYLADEPVEARPPSASYRLQKFVRRNKGSVIAAGLVLATLLVGVAGTSWGMVRAETRRKEAEQAREAESNARAAEKAQYARYRKTLNFAANELGKPIASAIYTKNAQAEFNRLLKRFVARIDVGDANDVNDRARLAIQLREADELRAQTNPDIETVRAKYVEAVATAERIAAAETREVDLAAMNVYACYSALGGFELTNREFAKALGWYAKALVVAEGVLQSPRTDEYTEAQRKAFVATTLNVMGYLNLLLNRSDDALNLCDKSLAIWVELIAADRGADNLAQAAEVHFRLAAIHRQIKAEASALEHTERSIELRRELIRSQPTNLAHKLELARQLGNLGDAFFFAGRLGDAKKTYDEALTLTRELSEPSELLAIQRSHSLNLYKAAVMSLKLGDRAGAGKQFDECLAVREHYSKAKPTDLSASIELMLAMARCGKTAPACTKAENLLKVAAAQKKDNPFVPRWRLMSAFVFATAADALDRDQPVDRWKPEQKAERRRLLDRSVQALELAVASGLKDDRQLETDPDIDGLRGDPRLAAIISKMQAPASGSKNKR